MKKFLISILSLAVVILTGFQIYASTLETYEGMFIEDEKISNEIGYGITHDLVHAQTKTNRPAGGHFGTGSSETTNPIDVDKFYSQQINILNVPSSKDIKIVSFASTEGSRWSLQKTRSHITEFESKNKEYKVVAAVNGDFYDIQGNGDFPYQPIGIHVQDGNVLKSNSGRPAIGFKNDGSLDSLVYYGEADNDIKLGRTNNPYLQVLNEKGEVIYEKEIITSNQLPTQNSFSVFYGQYNTEKKYIIKDVVDETSKHFKFEGTAFPNDGSDFYGRGKSVVMEETSYSLNLGTFSIVSKNTEVNEKLKSAYEVRVQHKMTEDFANVDNVIGLHNPLVYNGKRAPYYSQESYYTTRAPRTVVGRKADGTIGFMTMDGRSNSFYGVNQQEMMNILQRYDFVDGFNLDGGGSSTFLVREGNDFKVYNKPSDGGERRVTNSILIAIKEPNFEKKFVGVTKNSAELFIGLNDANGKDIDKIKVQVAGVMKEVIDNKVVFDGLTANTKYSSTIYYESNGKLNKTLQGIDFSTGKDKPIYDKIEVTIKEDTIHFNPVFVDDHKSLIEIRIIVNSTARICNSKGVSFPLFDYKKAIINVEYVYQLSAFSGLFHEKFVFKEKDPEFIVCDKINSLENATYENKADILKIKEEYDALTEVQKNNMPTYEKELLSFYINMINEHNKTLIDDLNKKFNQETYDLLKNLPEQEINLLPESYLILYKELMNQDTKSSCKKQQNIDFNDIIFTSLTFVTFIFVCVKMKKR